MHQVKFSLNSSNMVEQEAEEEALSKSPELYNKFVEAITKKEVDFRAVLLRNLTLNA